MNRIIYFAKLNLISDDIFRMYDNPDVLADVRDSLYFALKENKHWEKVNIFYDDTGEPHRAVIEYSTHILRIDNSGRYIEGWLYKKDNLYYKTMDRDTNKLVHQSTENIEASRFVLDTKKETVAFYRARRLGHKEFIEAFVEIINIGENAIGRKYIFNISLCSSGIDLDTLKSDLKSIGSIKSLKIKVQPPNPSDDILERIQKRADDRLEEMKAANVTGMEIQFTNSGSEGINLGSTLIDEEIDNLQGIYCTLSFEESMKKGYVKVDAVSISGQKYSSDDVRPLTIEIDVDDDFFEISIDRINQLR